MSMISIDNKDCFCFFFSSLCFSFWCKQNKVTYLKSQWKLMRTWLVQYYFLMFTDFTNEYLQHRYFSLFSCAGYWNPHEVFWHCSCCGSHVCPQDRLSFYCLRIWKSVCTFDQQINNYYSILFKLQPNTLYLDMYLLLFICYVCTSFF